MDGTGEFDDDDDPRASYERGIDALLILLLIVVGIVALLIIIGLALILRSS